LSPAIETLVETVAAGDEVTLVGFGSFKKRERKEQEGRNPKTGESMIIAATTVPGFSTGKVFKQTVVAQPTIKSKK
jgi:DNA-binding protein HU-beta